MARGWVFRRNKRDILELLIVPIGFDYFTLLISFSGLFHLFMGLNFIEGLSVAVLAELIQQFRFDCGSTYY